MRTVKGMVQVEGQTYRVVRLGAGSYEVIRLLDDAHVGTFQSAPRVEVLTHTIDPIIMLAIARAAVHGAKTSWVGRLLPV
jgi:hypothetical protein